MCLCTPLAPTVYKHTCLHKLQACVFQCGILFAVALVSVSDPCLSYHTALARRALMESTTFHRTTILGNCFKQTNKGPPGDILLRRVAQSRAPKRFAPTSTWWSIRRASRSESDQCAHRVCAFAFMFVPQVERMCACVRGVEVMCAHWMGRSSACYTHA